MARKNFRVTGGINIDTSAIPTSIIQETITSNSATTVDTIALDSFLAAEYTVTLTQGSKIRTSKVIMQTDGSSVDMTEFAITETGGTMSGVVVSATTASTNAVLQITVTDAASTLVRYRLVRNITTLVGYAPDAPTIGTASATETNGELSVTFTAPDDNGGSEITSYTIVSSPGNYTASGSSSPLVVSGLPASTSYTFTATATNAFGTSAASSSSNSATPAGISLSGGLTATDETYEYRIFTSSSTFSSNGSITGDVLVIAGGGGGTQGGGGGAGGLAYYANQSITGNTNYTVTVGSGGALQANINTVPASDGTNSVFGSLGAAIAGGGGATYRNNFTTYYTGRSGGSGGGGGGGVVSVTAATGGAGTAGQGFAGGNGGNTSTWSWGGSGGGGGGSAGVGGNGAGATGNENGGNGGLATDSYSSWLSACTSAMSGVSGWGTAVSGGRIAGGGGGNPSGSASWGTATGGGGSNSAGTENTGGGGSGGSSGNGGSGIVIVRVAKSQLT